MGPRDLPMSQRWLGLEGKLCTSGLLCPGCWFLELLRSDFSDWLPPRPPSPQQHLCPLCLPFFPCMPYCFLCSWYPAVQKASHSSTNLGWEMLVHLLTEQKGNGVVKACPCARAARPASDWVVSSNSAV